MVVETRSPVNRAHEAARVGERWVKTTCHGCVSNTCGMLVLVRNGVVVKAIGDPENPFNRGMLCARSHSLVFAVNDPNRVRRPLKRTNPEKGKGVDPKFVEISYEEAYDTVARVLKEQRQRDPRRLMSSFGGFTTNQWAGNIMGTPWGDPMRPLTGGYCGHSLHAQNHMYWATFHVNPDWKHIRYLIRMGSQKGAAVNHVPVTCAVEMAEARARGAKIVSVDPLASNGTSKAHEWLPIRPGTDGALVMAWMNLLANEYRIFDAEFLRTYTNTPYLVKDDGHYVRDPGTNKPMMWDETSGSAKVYDDPSLERPTLEGKYRVRLPNGSTVEAKTAFEVFKEWVRPWTPERASEITTIPVETIRRIAKEFGEAASIGSTIVIDGEVLPLRPAAIHWYRGISCHSNGYNTGRLISLIHALVGAMDVPGGTLSEAVYVDPPGLRERNAINGDKSGLVDVGDGIMGAAGGAVQNRLTSYWQGTLGKPEQTADGHLVGRSSGLFPASRMGGATVFGDMFHPDRHGKTLAPLLPETILLIFGSSLVWNMMDPDEMVKLFKQAKFVATVSSIIDEATEFADVVFPLPHFLERLEPFANTETNFSGPTHDGEYYCWNMRAPVVETDIPHHFDVWAELADRVGITADLNETLNVSLDLRGEYKLDPEQKSNWRDLMGRWVQQRLGRSLDEVLQEGQGHIKWKKSAKERYPRMYFKNARIPFYSEEFVDWKVGLEKLVKEMGLSWWDTRGYTPLPIWTPCPAYDRKDKGEFDLVTVTYKIPFVQATFGLSQPWAAELAELHPYVYKVWMNVETARRKGLADGDTVRVESFRNGKTVEAQVKVSECVHPEVIGVSSHGGDHWAKGFGAARGKGKAAWPQLNYHSHDVMDFMLGQPDHCVPVKVTKAVPKV